MEKLIMDLQLFAEEGAAAATAAGADVGAAAETGTGDTGFHVGDTLADGTQVTDARVAAALTRQVQRHPEMRKVYAQGQQPAAQVQQPQTSAEAQPSAEDRRAKWNEIKKEYHDLYGEDVGGAVKDRFKNQSDASEQLKNLQPMLEVLMQKAGTDSLEDLKEIILNDDSRYEEEAEEKGITVEALKYQKQLEAENAQKDQALQAVKDREHIQNLIQQGEEMKKIYPGFDMVTEMQNEKFRYWTSPAVGMSVKQAYDAIHGDELRTQAVAYGMDRTRQQLGQTIQAQRARPGEGAMSGKNQAAAAEPKVNPANLTKKERQAYKQMIRRGVPVSFD